MQLNQQPASLSSDSLVPKRRTPYIKTGLGGAGNFRPKPDTSTVTKATRPQLISPPSSRRFSTGIGGAGNCCDHKDRQAFAREAEELRARVCGDQNAVKFYHGIGGFGNRTVRRGSRDSIYSLSSASSIQSEKSSVREANRTPLMRLMTRFQGVL